MERAPEQLRTEPISLESLQDLFERERYQDHPEAFFEDLQSGQTLQLAPDVQPLELYRAVVNRIPTTGLTGLRWLTSESVWQSLSQEEQAQVAELVVDQESRRLKHGDSRLDWEPMHDTVFDVLTPQQRLTLAQVFIEQNYEHLTLSSREVDLLARLTKELPDEDVKTLKQDLKEKLEAIDGQGNSFYFLMAKLSWYAGFENYADEDLAFLSAQIQKVHNSLAPLKDMAATKELPLPLQSKLTQAGELLQILEPILTKDAPDASSHHQDLSQNIANLRQLIETIKNTKPQQS